VLTIFDYFLSKNNGNTQVGFIMQHARPARCAGCLNAASVSRRLQSFNSPSIVGEHKSRLLGAAVFIFLSRSPIIPSHFATGFVSCYRLEVLFRA
jgi:hypothetical protein